MFFLTAGTGYTWRFLVIRYGGRDGDDDGDDNWW